MSFGNKQIDKAKVGSENVRIRHSGKCKDSGYFLPHQMKIVKKFNKQKKMKPSVNDILSIRAGCFQTFACKSGAEIHEARSLISYIKQCKEMPSGVVNYKTTADFKQKFITIQAVAE